MGAHSTLHITRSRAKELYLDHVLKFKEPKISDSVLEHWLDNVLDKHLYNCVIVSDIYEDPDNVYDGWVEEYMEQQDE